MSINLRHVTSENTVILVCTTLGNRQRESGYRQFRETMAMFRNKVSIQNVRMKTVQ